MYEGGLCVFAVVKWCCEAAKLLCVVENCCKGKEKREGIRALL
jgi:hypothetical protein